jgi:predicted nucleic acid-binding protein
LIVIDASVVVELVLQTDRAGAIVARAFGATQQLHAPHLVDVEVAQALRRLLLAKQITPSRAQEAFEDFCLLVIERHAHRPLLGRIWALKASLSAYDATYVALAEALASPLLTCDGKLARTGGHVAQVELVPPD